MEQIKGIGTDILKISRIKELIENEKSGGLFLSRTYSDAEKTEISFCDHPLQSYADRFAGKEAVMKAMRIDGNTRFLWKEIEILHDPDGRPEVHFHGNMKEIAERLHIGRILLSLSYEDSYAVAFAVLTETSSL